MELIENEEYTFPYDMNPVTAPSYQTNLLQVLRISRDNIRDQRQKQLRRQSKEGGQELLSTFEIDEKRYPKYYAKLPLPNGWVVVQRVREIIRFPSRDVVFVLADAMRRRCLPHLNRYLKTQKKNAVLLDVATRYRLIPHVRERR